MEAQSLNDHGTLRRPVNPHRGVRGNANAKKPEPGPAEVDRADTQPSPAVPKSSGTAPVDTQESGRAAGVLRNLEAGHFKGVADVRLRINFFDELSARAAAAAQPVVKAQAGDLVSTVNGRVDELVAALAADERTEATINGLREQFDGAVQAAVGEFVSGGTVDRAGLAGALQTAFGALVDRLRETLTPEPPPAGPSPNNPDAEAPASTVPVTRNLDAGAVALVEPDTVAPEPTDAVDEPAVLTDAAPPDVVPDTGDDPVVNLDELLKSLTAVFDEALSSFLASITTAMRLPDPSPPSGNGAAYEKFMAIYNDLRGDAPEVEESA